MKTFIKIMAVVNVLIVLHMICGCEDRQVIRQRTIKELQVVERDECEYLVSQNAYGEVYSHKGDCKNPIHVYARKEEDEQNEVKKNRGEKRRK